MRFTESRWFAGVESLGMLLALCSAPPLQAVAATRPQYGGTLRIEMRTARVNLDPRQWVEGDPDSALNEQLGALVFDRLVSLDNYGRFQPQLATAWTHDSGFERWEFTIRSGVQFSDSSTLTPADVAAALQPLLPSRLRISAAERNVKIQSPSPMPDLLELLASGRYFIYRSAADGTLLGTGPFALADPTTEQTGNVTSETSQTAQKLRFAAALQCWAGRPFLDAIEVTLGVPALRGMFDVQLGKADLAILSPDVARRAAQSNLRVWASDPLTLYALQFQDSDKVPSDATLREAFSLSLDRTTMASVLLQRQAQPASSLLPQWLSGYAFLLNMETDPDRAKELQATLTTDSAGGTQLLLLRISAPGDLAELLGERVAVDARQAGFSVQIASERNPQEAGGNLRSIQQGAKLQLLVWRYTLLSPREELEAMNAALHPDAADETNPLPADPEQLYAEERRLLDAKKILPLVTLPDYVALSPAVRDWLPAAWGVWHLADVWLDRATPAPNSVSGAHP